MQRPVCTHCSMPFYIVDLNIHGLWYLQGVLEPTSVDMEGQLSFGTVKKMYEDVQVHGGQYL